MDGPPVFTFVNSTGVPTLPPSEAKLMRAHITKTNFAKRRWRIAQARIAQMGLKEGPTSLSPDPTGESELRLCSPSMLDTFANLREAISSIWSCIFLDCGAYPTNPDEEAWLRLLVSEPALLRSSLAVSMRQWTSDVSYRKKAEDYSLKAVTLLIRRIQSRLAHTDAILAVVQTMALGARIAGDKAAWDIHMDGMAQLLRERYAQGIHDLPTWFTDLLVSDLINNLFGIPRVYHMKVLAALPSNRYRALSSIMAVCDGVLELWDMIAAFPSDREHTDSEISKIDDFVSTLLTHSQSLRVNCELSVLAASLAIELIIGLSWRAQSKMNITSVATELKDALSSMPLRTCFYLDVTSAQLMIGAVAAEPGSQTRAWFVDKLLRAVTVLRLRGWDDPLEALSEISVSATGGVLDQLGNLCTEIRSEYKPHGDD